MLDEIFFVILHIDSPLNPDDSQRGYIGIA